MKIPFLNTNGGEQNPAPLLAALVLVALVPAVGVLWFMSVAMRNERLAVQARLSSVYANHLASLPLHVAAFGRERQAALSAHAGGVPAETFAAIVRAELADGVIITDGAGKMLYPSSAAAGAEIRVAETAEWVRARELEFQKHDFTGAAEIYGRIMESGREANARARAMQAQAGCWLKAGGKERALARLAELLADASLRHAVSAQGALIGPDVQLLILKTLGSPGSAVLQPAPNPAGTRAEAPRYPQTLSDLVARLNDYATAGLPANQRRFLMTEVQALALTPNLFPALAAEHLAADYLEREPASPATAANPQRLVAASASERTAHHSLAFAATRISQVWRLPSIDGSIVALFREERLRAELAAQLDARALPDVRVHVLAPGDAATTLKLPVPPQDAGELLPGWRLALSFRNGDPLAELSARQTRFYLWLGVGVVAIIGVLAVMVARYVAAQMRLARVKDELVSAVSHELKTPIASMRVLLDTLSAGRCRDEEHMERYLQLATRENLRLSRLIDNFLVFSRLERGQQQFHFTAVSPHEIVQTALEALREKLGVPGCHVSTQIAADVPPVRGDADALTTVLVNLIDNAFKYTNGDKQIAVSAHAKGDQVVLAVTDNGIGIASAERKRIFDRFYQVDQTLTRQRDGCGLGLSIVHSLVRAHGGTVEAESELGRGSTFRVRLPVETLNPQLSTPNAQVGAGDRRAGT